MSERPILMSGPMVRAILAGTKTQTRRVVKSPAKNMQAAGCAVIKRREPGDPWYGDHVWSMRGRMGVWGDYTHERFMQLCPYGVPGDLLWVRESWATSTGLDHRKPSEMEKPGVGYGWPIWYGADDGAVTWRGSEGGGPAFTTRGSGRPSIHMPRWASRITLRVTSVRVERVQDISEEDARAEGVKPLGRSHRAVYGMTLEGVGPVYPAPAADIIAGGESWTTSAARSFRGLWESINGAESWTANPWVWVVGFERVEASHA